MSKALADPPAQEWERVSPKLNAVEQISNSIFAVIAVGVGLLPFVLRSVGVWPGFPEWLTWLIPAALGALVLCLFVVTPFQVRNRRYALREDDVVVSRGVLYHRVEVIPYGRIQYVDVKAGPLMRAFGLCSLQVHTASPDAHPEIVGLPAALGSTLRDELSRRGEERLAGL